jgi:hypothetical protein
VSVGFCSYCSFSITGAPVIAIGTKRTDSLQIFNRLRWEERGRGGVKTRVPHSSLILATRLGRDDRF